jgi:hypothetical protein
MTRSQRHGDLAEWRLRTSWLIGIRGGVWRRGEPQHRGSTATASFGSKEDKVLSADAHKAP